MQETRQRILHEIRGGGIMFLWELLVRITVLFLNRTLVLFFPLDERFSCCIPLGSTFMPTSFFPPACNLLISCVSRSHKSLFLVVGRGLLL